MGPTLARLSGALAVLGAVLAATTASADPRPWFRDGERRVEVERLGGRALDAWGRSVAPVRLRYAGRDAPVVAEVDGTAIVELAPGAKERLPAFGAHLLKPLMPSIGLWLVEDAAGGNGVDVAGRLSTDPARAAGIRQAIPNLYLRVRSLGAPFTPNDPELGGQWYFKNLGMEDAWGLSQGDPKSTIVVVDGGCDLAHPDLVAKLDPGIDVADGDMDPSYDPAGMAPEHGTACAGIAGAATDNGVGIAGGCPACRLRCVRLTADKAVPISADVEAYQFALDVDAAVLTNSWGFVDPIPVPKALADAINNVFDNGRSGKGAMVVFAAGNDNRVLGDDELEAVRGVLCVGAINNYDEQAPFTNSGNAIDIVAPTGTVTTDIVGAPGEDPGDYTTTFGGTSSACPVVAGISGLLVGAAPERTSAELYEVLTHTTRKAPFAQPDATGHDAIYGYGIVDPVAALRDVLGLAGEPDGGADAGPKGTNPDEPDAEEGCGCEVVAADAPISRGSAYLGLAMALGLRRRLVRRAS